MREYIHTQTHTGITLIALIITIVVLLILAAVTINMVLGENGIFNKAKTGVDEYKKSEMAEKIQMMLVEYKMENVTTGKTLKAFLDENGYDYEIDEDTGKIVIEEDGYLITIDPNTLEVEKPEKNTKTAKIILSSKIVEPNGSLTATLKFGEGVDPNNCYYKYTKDEITDASEITEKVNNLTISLPTNERGNYTFYLLVGYKDESESRIKKARVMVGIAVESITLNKRQTTIEVGNTETLTANILPANASEKGIKWSTTDANIATVSQEGLVTAVAPGETTIIATAIDGSETKESCTVTVPRILVNSITISSEKSAVNLGKTQQIQASILPTNATNQNIDWHSSNEEVATVDNTGKVTGISLGEVTITATSKDGSNITSNNLTLIVREAGAEVGASSHTAAPLTYSWEEINELARKISLNYETEIGTERITKDAEEVILGDYTIGVGDTIAVGSYTARVLGFNQDLLATSVENQYGDNETHTRAGISFEFVSFLTSTTLSYDYQTPVGGWGACPARSTLNNTTINSLANKNYIKLVTKKYLPYTNDPGVSSCEDKLWLLAASEIWNNVNISESDGVYKYYAKGHITYNSNKNYLLKPSLSEHSTWWLRSLVLYGGSPVNYKCVDENGNLSSCSGCDRAYGISPGFCV